MTTSTDYEQALAIIRRLDRPLRARLVAEVVQELAIEPTVRSPALIDPRAVLAEIRTHFAALGPVSPTVGEQIDLDRQSRADLLEGTMSDEHVHS
jgi:hypothetical protein